MGKAKRKSARRHAPHQEIARNAIRAIYKMEPEHFAHIRTQIAEAAKQTQMVKMLYVRKYDGRPTTYYVEPYEFKGPYFYGYHPRHESIHSFLRHRIVKAEPAKKTFEPRWPVKTRTIERKRPKKRRRR